MIFRHIVLGASFILLIGFFLFQYNNESEQRDEFFSGEVLSDDESKDYSFDKNYIIEEKGRRDIQLGHDMFWLSSGAYFISENGIARTHQGELEEENKWRKIYDKNNPRDTDRGLHPQNIFRLVTLGSWTNLYQQGYFRIVKDNKSDSEYRNDSNGLLFFNRYQDGDNLYYTGIRVDGFAVIKKKIKGKYFTLAYNKIYPGKYDREKNPNLLPHNQWIGLRSEVKNNGDESVNVKLYLDRERDGNWELVAEAVDEPNKFGENPFFNAGYGGIRTDFMDVEFDDYRLNEF